MLKYRKYRNGVVTPQGDVKFPTKLTANFPCKNKNKLNAGWSM